MTRGDARELTRLLRRIDGRGYRAYKEIGGAWELEGCSLVIDHVQGDPFADPSRVRVRVPGTRSQLPPWACQAGSRSAGLASHLARTFARHASKVRARGSGKSGRIEMESPGQEVLAQSAVSVAGDGGVEARFRVGLPATGRRVLADEASRLLLEEVPRLVDQSLVFGAYEPDSLRLVVETNEDADALRTLLGGLGLLAFVADGSVLPRASGVDDRPLREGPVVPFGSPPTLRVELDLPNAGRVSGMGIPEGVTVITGGGYHGKSTLLRALERGVYNHRPGDGREKVVTDPHAVKVRAEDGRSVSGVDISPFIGRLPFGGTTDAFSTANASGSTSQAAAIVEALEAGATALLVDEDTTATNFMIRDRRMQALVPKAGEPITPFVDRVRQLHESRGVSCVLVIGGSGDYLEVADTVVAMREYRAIDVTEEARAVVSAFPTGRLVEVSTTVPPLPRRLPERRSIDPRYGRRDVHVRVHATHRIRLGTSDLDLTAVEQIVCPAQTRALAAALVLAREFMDGEKSVPEVLDRVMEAVDLDGLDVLDPRQGGDLAAFRRHELAAVLNRLRALEVTVVPR